MVSQFTIYSSSDVNGPGPIFGATGSLNKILEYCLVSGSVSKVAAGWSHPIANSASVAGDSTVYACYRPPSGSRMTLFVNDNAPNLTSTGKEAWLTGWENMTSLCNTVYTANVGAGVGQFPTPEQSLTTGHIVCRKSATSNNTTERYWMIAADAYTFYMWILTGDVITSYTNIGFGDIFSLQGTSDVYRCFIIGRATENTAVGNAQGQEATDLLTNNYGGTTQGMVTAHSGQFMARTYGGGGSSIIITRKGDASASGGYIGTSYYAVYMNGMIQMPNGTDNSIHLSPCSIVEPACLAIRGRFRGIYHVCHPIGSFSDGQTFAGGGDFAGKTFKIIRNGPNSAGVGLQYGTATTGWALEISNTVETNT